MRTQGCETGDNPELSVVPFTMASEGSGAPPVDGVTLAVFEHRFERRAGRRTAMARRHADPIEVRGPGSGGTAGAGEQPTHFLWRDRVYAVREVLGHWRESGPWWEAVRAAPQQGVSRPAAAGATPPECTSSASTAPPGAGRSAGAPTESNAALESRAALTRTD